MWSYPMDVVQDESAKVEKVDDGEEIEEEDGDEGG